jgi:hypothetical protein
MGYRSVHFDLLHLVHAFSRLTAYAGVMPRRLLVLDLDLVEEMVRNKLLERKRVRFGRTALPQEGVALTSLGRRLVDISN